jgi:hypothetical protein
MTVTPEQAKALGKSRKPLLEASCYDFPSSF